MRDRIVKWTQGWMIAMLGLCLVACGHSGSTAESVADAVAMPASKMAAAMPVASSAMLANAPAEAEANAAVRKYIALRHSLVVELSAEAMQVAFDATIAQCERLQGQLILANFNKQTSYSPPSANLSLRLPPQQVAAFLQGLATQADIIQHLREAEDKTTQVVDTDAKIHNLTELRDRLRAMLADKHASFKDIIEVERQLAETQSQLDSLMAVRKVLSQETDFVALNVQFNAKQGLTEQGFFAPVAQALKNAGRVMMESLAAVITFIMTALPWLLLGIPLLLLVRKFWSSIKIKLFAAK